MSHNPTITTLELSVEIGITESGVEKQIKKLKDAGDICRDGGDNGGKWIVLK